MSNENKKPTIFGYCPAGCMWETVHKEDFLKAASLINQPIQNGVCYLETSKQYKIFATNNNGFACSIKFVYTDGGTRKTYTFSIPADDKYADSVVFKVLETSINENVLTIVYEIAGVRYIEEISGSSLALINNEYLFVENADKVCLYNSDASVIAYGEKGEKGEKGDSGLADGAVLSNTYGTSDTDGYTQKAVNNLISNPNLLINGDFRINQRGQSSYNTAFNYTVDRWFIFDNGLVVTPNADGSITLQNTGSNFSHLLQYIENPSMLSGKVVTYSMEITSINGIAFFSGYDGVNDFLKTNMQETGIFSETIQIPSNYNREFCRVGVYLPPNSSVTIKYIKLEFGSVATPNHPRPYAEELAMCQRYYQKIKTKGTVGTFGFVAPLGSGTALGYIPLITTMRTSPTFAYSGNFQVLCVGVGQSRVSNMSYALSTDTIVTIDITLETSIGSSFGNLRSLDDSNAYISLDAEIY